MTAEKAINDWTRHADAAQFSLTDTGNARRLVHYTGDIIRYVPEWATWLVWDGVRWSPDGLGVVVEFMKVIATQNMIEEAQTVTNEDRRQHLLKWAMASESVSRIKAAIELAKTDVDVAVSAETLDTEKWLLTCLNGTLDLKTGELRPARQDDLITKLVPFEYDPAAKCPQFEKFLDWALCGRAGLVDFVQRALGYSMTGDVSERKMFFLHGQGQNGKSTLLKTFRRILGDYAAKADAATFMLDPKNSGDAATPSLARLKGARMINSAEMEDGMAMAESLVKDWIGDDSVTARHLYERKVEFWPEFKFWISSNYLPTVSAVDQAVWDRLRLIPFDARISEEDKDLELYDKLLEEAPGILAWAVRGLIAWHARHLNVDVPVEVLAAGAQYREDMDFFKHFLEDLPAGQDWGLQDMQEAYTEWSKTNRAKRLNAIQFKTYMTQHGYTVKTVKGARSWRKETDARPGSNVAQMVRAAKVPRSRAAAGA
jgi:putative DNA primase/helicase